MKQFTPIPLGFRMHAAMSQNMEEMQPYRHRASIGVTACRRKLTYHAMGFEPKPPAGRMGIAFDDGHYTEAQSVEMLKLVPGVELVAEQVPVKIPQCPEPGHADFILKDGEKWLLVEHKNYSMFKFDGLESGKYQPTDALYQLVYYAHWLSRDEWAFDSLVLFVRNRNTGAYLEYWFTVSHGMVTCVGKFSTRLYGEELPIDVPDISVAAVVERYETIFATVDGLVKNQMLAKRDYVTGIDWQCSYCAFSHHCNDSLPETMEVVKRADGAVKDKGLTLEELRRNRLAAEKAEDVAKLELIHAMREESALAIEIDGQVYVREIVDAKDPDGETMKAEKLKKISLKTYQKNGGKDFE